MKGLGLARQRDYYDGKDVQQIKDSSGYVLTGKDSVLSR